MVCSPQFFLGLEQSKSRLGFRFGAKEDKNEGQAVGIPKLAGVAQLVEHNVANVVVVGSNPITRFWTDLVLLCF